MKSGLHIYLSFFICLTSCGDGERIPPDGYPIPDSINTCAATFVTDDCGTIETHEGQTHDYWHRVPGGGMVEFYDDANQNILTLHAADITNGTYRFDPNDLETIDDCYICYLGSCNHLGALVYPAEITFERSVLNQKTNTYWKWGTFLGSVASSCGEPIEIKDGLFSCKNDDTIFNR